MIRTKKLISLFLVLICAALILVSCTSADVVTTEKENASSTYKNAKKKVESLDSLNVIKVIEREFSGDTGEFSDMSVTNITKNISDKDSAQYLKTYTKTSVDTKGNETTVDSMIYCVDNIVYEKTVDGNKFSRYDTSDETIENNFSSLIPELSSKALKDSTLYTSKEGVEVVSNTAAENIHSILHSTIEGVNDYYSPMDDSTGFAFEYSTVSINFTAADDYIRNITIEFTADFAHKDGNATITSKVIWDVIDPGKTVEVTAPEGLSDYVLLTTNESEETALKNELLVAVQALYDDFGNELPNFDELYTALCEKYTEEAVNEAITEYNPQF
ncbi:MAG: hypothetical protein E7652_04930 [Ruminococcaceae bacterium]|nr:hypothetical protein [Oscillospiraceae bacterium]